MPSRFKQSLDLIKDFRNEEMYRFKNESDFINKYLENSSFSIDEQLMLNQEQFSERYPFLPNPLIGGFYNNFYAAFVFVYEIENVLDEIECFGVNLTRAETLMNLCGSLSINSSNVLMDLDDDFSFRKKYSLVNDVLVMAKNMYDYMLFAHNIASIELDFDDSVSITKYDEIGSRLSCKYIRNGISLLKLFHVLVLLRISPFYSDDVHDIADKLISQLREPLFDKRIIKIVVDSNIYGENPKPHKTTRLKILFALGNSDRYCIRLDFPHDGENCIHLNMNEPARNQSTGLPFVDCHEALQICGEQAVFDELFYHRDDLYWFRSDFATTLKRIKKENPELGAELEKFQRSRAHIYITSSDSNQKDAVRHFSEAFAEAITDYEGISVFGETDESDDEIYQLLLFQDDLFDTVIKLQGFEMSRRIDIKEQAISEERANEFESKIRTYYCDCIAKKFYHEANLVEFTQKDLCLCDFLCACLDCLERLMLST